VSPHHLDDHHAVVRLGRRVQAVDRLCRDRHGGVEPERVVGAGEVVVDRLRHADDGKVVLGMKLRGDAQGVLASDDHERIETRFGHVRENRADPALHLVRVRPRRPEDRASPRQDPGGLATPQRHEDALGQALPTVADADHLVAVVGRPADDGPDHRVQAGTVAPAGQYSDPHCPHGLTRAARMP
jgi:hypothetical protein